MFCLASYAYNSKRRFQSPPVLFDETILLDVSVFFVAGFSLPGVFSADADVVVVADFSAAASGAEAGAFFFSSAAAASEDFCPA